MSDGPEWFAAKRYGMGASLPISWQGWAVTVAYLLLLGLASLLIRYTWAGFFSVVINLTVAVTAICSRTTRGGWRWRWGDSD